MRRVILVAVVAFVVATVVFAACSSSTNSATPKVAGMPAQSATVGNVEVKVTPTLTGFARPVVMRWPT